MDKESLRSYNAVINHTLLKAIELGEQSPKNQKLGRRGIAGFCQLQGSTGSGKSSSLYRQSSADAIAPALELIKDANRQVILVTHRWNILHDIFHSAISHTDSKSKPFSVSVLYAQDENVVSAVTKNPLPHEKDLQPSDMPDPFDAIKRLATRHLLVHDDMNEKLSQTCSRIKSVSDSLKSKNSRLSPKYIALEEEDLRRYCASLERILLKNMAALEKEVKKQQGSMEKTVTKQKQQQSVSPLSELMLG